MKDFLAYILLCLLVLIAAPFMLLFWGFRHDETAYDYENGRDRA